MLRSPRPVGKGTLSLRIAASYLDLSQRFAPVTYLIEPIEATGLSPTGSAPNGLFARLGPDVRARVGLFTLSATYGLTHRVDASFTVPVTVVDASASQSFTTRTSALGVPAREAPLTAARTREDLDAALAAGLLSYRRESFTDLGFAFNEGAHAGVGRISMGARAVVYADQRWRVAFVPGLFLPSPTQSCSQGLAFDPSEYMTAGRIVLSPSAPTQPAYSGELDEVRIWNLARDAADIRAAMNDRLAGDEPGLVGYWPISPSRVSSPPSASISI